MEWVGGGGGGVPLWSRKWGTPICIRDAGCKPFTPIQRKSERIRDRSYYFLTAKIRDRSYYFLTARIRDRSYDFLTAKIRDSSYYS